MLMQDLRVDWEMVQHLGCREKAPFLLQVRTWALRQKETSISQNCRSFFLYDMRFFFSCKSTKKREPANNCFYPHAQRQGILPSTANSMHIHQGKWSHACEQRQGDNLCSELFSTNEGVRKNRMRKLNCVLEAKK